MKAVGPLWTRKPQHVESFAINSMAKLDKDGMASFSCT